MEFGKPLYEITFYLKQTQLQKKKICIFVALLRESGHG